MNFASSTNFVSTTFSLPEVGDDPESDPAPTREDWEETRHAIKTVFLACTDVINLNCGLDRPVPLGDEGAELIGVELKSSWVTTLWLEGQNIGPAGAAAIGDALEHNSSITSISLANNPLHDRGVQVLANSISSSFCPVSFLNLRNCNIIRVPYEFVDCKSLRNLQLGDNPITFPPKHVVIQGTFMLMQFLERQMEEDRIMASTMAKTGQFQSMLMSIHGDSANMTNNSEKHAMSGGLRTGGTQAATQGGTDTFDFRSRQFLSTSAELLPLPPEPEDRARGTWWHSVLPSIDPVALTWKAKQTTDAKEGEGSTALEVEGLVYCDLGENFSPFAAARRNKAAAKNRSPVQHGIQPSAGDASAGGPSLAPIPASAPMAGTGNPLAKPPQASDKRGRRMAII